MGTHHIALFPNEQFLDLRPYQYGWEECAPLHSFGPFVRNHYLLHYIISGRGMLYSHASNGDIHEYSLKGGQGFLICPGQINLYTADRTPEEGDLLQEQMLYFSEHASRSPLHLVGRLSLFLDDLIEFSDSRQEIGQRSQRDFYINEAVVYIQQNYHRELTVDEVAGFCKLNRNYFSRKFKEVVGCSPQEFLIRQRLSNAAELMRLTDLPIKAIAAQCGYPNQLHFSQAFRKHYGLPPREWRRQNRE